MGVLALARCLNAAAKPGPPLPLLFVLEKILLMVLLSFVELSEWFYGSLDLLTRCLDHCHLLVDDSLLSLVLIPDNVSVLARSLLSGWVVQCPEYLHDLLERNHLRVVVNL